MRAAVSVLPHHATTAKGFIGLAEARALSAQPVFIMPIGAPSSVVACAISPNTSWPWTMNSPSECNDALRMRKFGDASSAFSQRDKGGKLQAMRRIRRFGNGEFLEQCEEHDFVMGADRGITSRRQAAPWSGAPFSYLQLPMHPRDLVATLRSRIECCSATGQCPALAMLQRSLTVPTAKSGRLKELMNRIRTFAAVRCAFVNRL